jgi:plasmid maintenance system antidote protein VapI
MMRKRVPTHPGAILREDVLPSLPGMSVSAFARNLGVSRQTLHAVLAERSGVTAEMVHNSGWICRPSLTYGKRKPNCTINCVK